MIIGTPKEVKTQEARVGLIPSSVHELVKEGHEVWIEHNAGYGIELPDAAYEKAGAKIGTAEQVYEKADLIVKVKEPQPEEFSLIRENQILFTYLHLAPDLRQTEALLKSGCIAIAYETIQLPDGKLPLLQPMSEIAGRLSVQEGMHFLQRPSGGRGILLGGVPGVVPGQVVVIGGGAAGTEALKVALGTGARTTIIDKSVPRLRELSNQFGHHLKTIYAVSDEVEEALIKADLIIGAVLIPGAHAPKVINRSLLKKMKKGAVVVDIAIDQGGCLETSRPTTFADPVFTEEGVIHYCVTNMPGAVPYTSTFALNHATLPYIQALANQGYRHALLHDESFLQGLNICNGKVTHKQVAHALGLPYTPPLEALG